MTQIRQRAIDGLRVGDTFTSSRTFTEEDVARFADLTHDYNPVHFDDRFAGVKGFSGRICHGLLVAAVLTEIGGQLGWLASGMNFRFKKPVYVGDRITCFFKVTEIGDRGRAKAEVVFENQNGVSVADALLTGIVPGHAERAVLREMVAEGDPTNRLHFAG